MKIENVKVTPTDDTDNEDEVTSSFSLQECMDEFRARRIRRSSRHRLVYSNEEIDLIKQNLCNKQHERQVKPCKDGFCYCFTSDSGEGGGTGLTCIPPRQTRRQKRSICGVGQLKLGREEKTTSNPCGGGCPSAMDFKAVSRLETSHGDAPFIQIVQELRDNCIISEVRVNKDQIKKEHVPNRSQTLYYGKPSEPQTPTAPTLQNSPDSKKQQTYLSDEGNTAPSEKRHKAGGRLLQKRLSISKLKLKELGTTKPPPKPPRSSCIFDKQCSLSTNGTSSTSSSVRAAECVLHNFLEKRGHKLETSSEQLSQKDESTFDAKQIFAKYPSMSEIERVVGTKKLSNYERNIMKNEQNQPKVLRIGWSEPKISVMLNNDSNVNGPEFQSSIAHAEPQHTNHLGWQAPPKINIDEVDGIMRHNLASNIEKKSTPMRTKHFRPGNIWSEHIRNFSPWSNKNRYQGKSYVSNLGSSSKEFLKSSKKKILRLVSPKKENKHSLNFQIPATPYRNTAIQTSCVDLSNYSYLQSPPGSYHSPEQSSSPQSPLITNTSANEIMSGSTQFDFSRQVQSPPKKTTRSSQRRLDFPFSFAKPEFNDCDLPDSTKELKTYRSFNGDQDDSFSKVRSILSNIRFKLEASDESAIRTFWETENRAVQKKALIAYPDIGKEETKEIRSSIQRQELDNSGVYWHNDPIYSEIEDNTFRLLESPIFENHTEVQNFNINETQNVLLYAEVNKLKKNKNSTSLEKQTPKECPLGKFLHDSLQSKRITPKKPSLSPLPEPPGGEFGSYSSSISGRPSHCLSMNNIRVMGPDSTPNKQRHLCKSDLSLHRSEIFLENLCKSVLMEDSVSVQPRFNKIENNDMNQTCNSSISRPLKQTTQNSDCKSAQYHELYDVSYEVPDYEKISCVIMPPSPANQSTPKKQRFTTKAETEGVHLNVDILPIYNSDSGLKLSYSYPNSSRCPKEALNHSEYFSRPQSYNDIFKSEMDSNELMFTNTIYSFNRLKNVIHNSFRKSREFVKKETRRMSTSLIFTRSFSNGISNIRKNVFTPRELPKESAINSDSLFSLNQYYPVNEQLAQVVSICRQLPDADLSTEMVEAERLLLFSELARRKEQLIISPLPRVMDRYQITYLFVDDMFLQINTDINFDIYFNYFYIVTFECCGIIRSTQSAECQNGVATFRDCGIEFMCRSDWSELDQHKNSVQCKIFVLRLRKISGLELDPTKKTYSKSNLSGCSSSLTSTSSNEIISRFCLHASFTLNSKNFIPYEYVPYESKNADIFCLRASRICNITLTPCNKLTNLTGALQLKGRAEIRFPKVTNAGFLNVEDPFSQHNWNRLWCTLDGVHLSVWKDDNDFNKVPLFTLDLRGHQHYVVKPAPLEICARPRSFCIPCSISKSDKDLSTSKMFFAADTQDDLNTWLDSLNHTLLIVNTWFT